MKKINLKEELKDVTGKVVSQQVKVDYQEEVEGELVDKFRMEQKTLTVGLMLTQALLKRETEITEEELLKRLDLFDKINGQSEVSLSKEEVEFLKKLIINRFDVFFAGTLVRILK